MLSPVVYKTREQLGFGPRRAHQETILMGLVAAIARAIKLACRQEVPDLLCHKRHSRMQQAQACIKNKDEVALHLQALGWRTVKQAALTELDVPVANFIPEERLQVASIITKVIYFKLGSGQRDFPRKSGKHPSILCGFGHWLARLIVLEIHLHEAAGVPDLRHKRA